MSENEFKVGETGPEILTPALEQLLEAAVQVRVSGEGVVLRAGQIVKQDDQEKQE